MQISHAEARYMLQLQADRALHDDQPKLLNHHMEDCAECRTYASELNQTETILKNVMRRQWNRNPAPLSMDTLLRNKNGKKSGTLLLTRTAMISTALLLFVFIGLQFTTMNSIPTHSTQFSMPLIPTPSTQITATILSKDCRSIQYQVRERDTLEDIATRFDTSKVELVQLNNLNSETLHANETLLIPVCDTTPTSTLYAPTFTITPFLDTTATIPG